MNAIKLGHLVALFRTLCATALFCATGVYAADVIKIGIPVGLSGANSVVAPSVVQSAVPLSVPA